MEKEKKEEKKDIVLEVQDVIHTQGIKNVETEEKDGKISDPCGS